MIESVGKIEIHTHAVNAEKLAIDLEDMIRRRQDILRGYPLPPPSLANRMWAATGKKILEWVDNNDWLAPFCFVVSTLFFAMAAGLQIFVAIEKHGS